jgi:predicted flap endonuclease-1-like 5' DNA nuclease
VFEETVAAKSTGKTFDPAIARRRGRLHILQLDGDEALIAVGELEDGGSRQSATEVVNEHRAKNGLDPVSESTIYALTRRLNVQTTRVKKRPQGDYSPGSPWAQARFNWTRQLGVLYRTWEWNSADGPCPKQFDPAHLPHIQRQQVAFWDETAKKCSLDGAHSSQYQHRFPRDKDGKLDPNGVVTAPEVKKMVPKFQQRCDLIVGVAVVALPDAPDTLVARRLKPVDYTGKWVYTERMMDQKRTAVWAAAKTHGSTSQFVTGRRPKPGKGVELFDNDDVARIPGVGAKVKAKLTDAGITTVGQLKAHGDETLVGAGVRSAAAAAEPGTYVSVEIDHRKADNPYESLYGADWRARIDESTGMRANVSIRTLWTSVMESTVECFRGTTHEKTFRIYHDALSQLTADETKTWLKTQFHEGRSWFDIWITPLHGLNDGTCYAGRPVGNSPELMPLDCSLLADLSHDLSRHVRITKALPSTNPLKFSRSTPGRLSSSLRRLLWHDWGADEPSFDPLTGGSPSAKRIVEDVKKCMDNHITAIIEAKGAMVDGIGNRVGVRARPIGRHGGARTKHLSPPPRWVHPHGRAAAASKVQLSLQGAGGGAAAAARAVVGVPAAAGAAADAAAEVPAAAGAAMGVAAGVTMGMGMPDLAVTLDELVDADAKLLEELLLGVDEEEDIEEQYHEQDEEDTEM